MTSFKRLSIWLRKNIVIIIHLKYVSVSDWLKSRGLFFKPTSVELNLQDLRDSWKMTSIVQGNRQKKGREPRRPGGSKDNGLCWQLVNWQNGTTWWTIPKEELILQLGGCEESVFFSIPPMDNKNIGNWCMGYIVAWYTSLNLSWRYGESHWR